MEYKIMNGCYYIKINKGESLMKEIQAFSQTNNVCGSFSGIGAANKVIISTYLPEKKEFLNHTQEGMLEIVSLTGNVSLDQKNKPVVHAHACFSYLNGKKSISIIAGDLCEAKISYTCELVFHSTGQPLYREFDKNAEIDVWKLS